jgi:hypothetical protein
VQPGAVATLGCVPEQEIVMWDFYRLARGAGYSVFRSLGFALFNWELGSNPKIDRLTQQRDRDIERMAGIDPALAEQLRAEHKANDQLFEAAFGSVLRDESLNDTSTNAAEAIKSGNLIEFRRFVQANPHALDAVHEPNHWTLLHDLAALGSKTLPVHCTMALELIEAGADVNCRTPLGWTPIILIAMHGQKEAISLAKILIDHGADVGAVDKYGYDWQLYWQHGKEIRTLLDAAMTPAQREANRLRLEQLYSPKRS